MSDDVEGARRRLDEIFSNARRLATEEPDPKLENYCLTRVDRILRQIGEEVARRIYQNDQSRQQPANTEPAMPDDLTDSKIAAAEARTDAKLARYEGSLNLIAAKIDGMAEKIETQRSEAKNGVLLLVSTVVSSTLVLAGLIYAMLSFGATSWYNGTVMRDQVATAVQLAIKQSAPKAP